MSDEKLVEPIDPVSTAPPVDITGAASIGTSSTALNGIIQVASQPNITALPGITSISSSLYTPNGNTSLGANVDVSKLYVYNSDLLPTGKSGVCIHQDSSLGDAHLHLNAYGTKHTMGIDQSDGYKFKISRSQSLDANPVVTIDPNYVASVTAVSTWTTRASAVDNTWYSVCWSPELRLFCAVSLNGTGDRVMTSPNGINWTIRTSAADNQWQGICWSPELRLFVVVGGSGAGNRAMTSPDGITWTERFPPDNNWNSVCWSPELRLFVAVAESGTGDRVMTSPDGINWTLRTSATDNNWTSVCWSPELRIFVSVAYSGTGDRVMTSHDGVTWTSRTSAADNQWRSVVWSPELRLFAAVSVDGGGNNVMTSPNGITWTIRAAATSSTWVSVCWSSELRLFCATSESGSGNRVMTSPDGITWTSRTSAADNSWRSICWSPELGIFAAISYDGIGNRIMTNLGLYSNQPTTTITGTLTAPNIGNNLYLHNGNASLGYNKDSAELYVYNSNLLPTTKSGIIIHQDSSLADAHLQLNAYGTKNTIGIDISDGYKFKIARGPQTDANPLITLDPNYVTSATAVTTWTSRTSAADNLWRGICWSPELRLFCAVSSTGSGNHIMTSPNGITWTSRTSAANNSWYSVCWSPELRLFCAVSVDGSNNRVMTSPDGITWTSRTTDNSSWFSVCWSPELRLFCAVCASLGPGVMTSPDGITWTTRNVPTPGNYWISVCWSSELRLFCAVAGDGSGGENGIMTSPDGIIWTNRTLPVDNKWVSVCWSPELRLFASVSQTGTGNRVMTSPDGITWTTRTSPIDNSWNTVCWSSELKLFCAISANGGGNQIMTSPDGITWTLRASAAGNLWRSLCWAPELGMFAAVSITGTGNRVMTSTSMYGNAPNITVAGIRGKTTGVADAINVVIDSTGQLGTTSSSITKKHNVRDMANFTSRIYDLNPVIFKWKPEHCQDQTDQYGLIAERVAEVFPELAVKDPNDVNYLTVAYQSIPVMLVNEFKKLKAKSDRINTRLGI